MNVSVVVPCYRSADCLPELVRRVNVALQPHYAAFELILVNDASPDASWAVISELADRHPFVVGLNLRKNVGQDNAIMAGLHQATGDAVIIMDDDLQHDPDDIPDLVAALAGGADVVYATFDQKLQAWWKNAGSWFNGRVAVLVLGKPPDVYMSAYKAIRQEVVRDIVRYDGPFTYVDGIIFTVTGAITQVPATHHTRFAGHSNYNLIRSLRVWLKLATGFSVIPLRVAAFMGGAIALLSFFMAAYFVVQALMLERVPEGYPSLIVSVFFLGGIQLVALGALGEYIGRIFLTQNRTPQFTIKEVRRRGSAAGAPPP
ncbi:MAG TPA: glycosyltransferase family 2 protein [Vicinamibacterales bacterium]|nr:glycosyltransferase family 2 protein [Vicinamibacterales bacterium]